MGRFPEYSPVFLSACKSMALDQVFPGMGSSHPVDYETKLKELVKKYGVDANETAAIADTFIEGFEKQKGKLVKEAKREERREAGSLLFRLLHRKKPDET